MLDPCRYHDAYYVPQDHPYYNQAINGLICMFIGAAIAVLAILAVTFWLGWIPFAAAVGVLLGIYGLAHVGARYETWSQLKDEFNSDGPEYPR